MSFEEHVISTNNKKMHLDGFQLGTTGIGDHTIRELNDPGKELPAGIILTKISASGNDLYGPEYIIFTTDSWVTYDIIKYRTETSGFSNMYDMSPSGNLLAVASWEGQRSPIYLRIYKKTLGVWSLASTRNIVTSENNQGDFLGSTYDAAVNSPYAITNMKWSDNETHVFCIGHQTANQTQWWAAYYVLRYTFNGTSITHDVQNDRWVHEIIYGSSNGQKPDAIIASYCDSVQFFGTPKTAYKPSFDFIDVIGSTAYCVMVESIGNSNYNRYLYKFDYGIVQNENAPGFTYRPTYMIAPGTNKLIATRLTTDFAKTGQPCVGKISNDRCFSVKESIPTGSSTNRKFLYGIEINDITTTPILSDSDTWPIQDVTPDKNYFALHDLSLTSTQKIGNDGKTAIIKIRKDFTTRQTKPYETTTLILSSNDMNALGKLNTDCSVFTATNNKNYYEIQDISKNTSTALVIAGKARFIRGKTNQELNYNMSSPVLKDRDFKGSSTIDSTNENGLGAGIAYHDLSIKQTSDYTYASNPKTYANLIYGVVIL